jgi:hypothetical protein
VGRDGNGYTTDLGQVKSEISEIPNYFPARRSFIAMRTVQISTQERFFGLRVCLRKSQRLRGAGTVEISSSQTLEEAVNIAWVYLQRTGDLGDGNAAAVFLTNTIDSMMRRGQRNRMFLANKAIIKYRAFRDKTDIVPIRESA